MTPTGHSTATLHKRVDFLEYRFPSTARESLAEISSPELRYIRAGSAVWQIGDFRRRIVAGDVLLSPRGGGEVFVTSEEGLDVEALSVPEAVWSETGVTDAPGVLHRSALASECSSTMRDCRYEKALGRPGWERYIEARTQLLLVHLYRLFALRHPEPPRASVSSDPSHLRVREYVRSLESGFSIVETLETEAAKLGLGARRFSDLFREITGMTWLKYIHSRQVLQAQRLLAAKEDRVGLIARQSGFEDETTFYRVFKRNTGITPGEWRARARMPQDGPSATFALLDCKLG